MNKAPKLMVPLLGAAAGVAAIAAVLFYGLFSSGGKPVGDGVAAFAVGDMEALEVNGDATAQPTSMFRDADGGEHTLAEFQGKPILVNLWATWCAPCVRELPELNSLHARFGGEEFAVIAISLDRDVEGARRFYEEQGIGALNFYSDPTMRLGAEINAAGLPITVLYDAEGQEMARLAKDAHWDGPDARALIQYVLSAEGQT